MKLYSPHLEIARGGFVRPSGAHTCGWLTHGRFLFFASPKKRNQKKGDPDGATPFSRTRLCLGSRPTVPPCTGVRPARSLAPSFGCSAKGLRRSNAPYGARYSLCGLTPLPHPPRRRASVEERPKSSLKGRVKDHARAHPAQGCAVCAPPEADLRCEEPAKPASLPGQDGFGDFPRKESHPGVQGAERPASSFCFSAAPEGRTRL